ncbi:hypothetical protein [Paraflavitalea speifideaquila]|uniref:hypothetical protein n=1 Tax=Paraflavitalea speifideaquila TaxID=3076558 RepID=UPI0028E376A5|nr:hypothetical protein [Paraflavitalea speifideiaquila]
MKKMLPVLVLTVIGCMGVPGAFARPQHQFSVNGLSPTSSQQEGYQYKIYRDNGQYAGSCTVQHPAELDMVARQLGKGKYLFVGVGNSLASADRRIIVYLDGGPANTAIADRRIIVY